MNVQIFFWGLKKIFLNAAFTVNDFVAEEVELFLSKRSKKKSSMFTPTFTLS